ncbi:hypothetical protein BBO99_00006529 [Phytophthora kernoviae]|uniref:Uncharacterized protein n=1 Tax=Phytophthora kernoviae TaxID=325452 RepID=A0A421GL62_9STRA|nr:hypothetical protein BBO99_00006529 [Phytophthora kernoviae]
MSLDSPPIAAPLEESVSCHNGGGGGRGGRGNRGVSRHQAAPHRLTAEGTPLEVEQGVHTAAGRHAAVELDTHIPVGAEAVGNQAGAAADKLGAGNLVAVEGDTPVVGKLAAGQEGNLAVVEDTQAGPAADVAAEVAELGSEAVGLV